MLEGFGEAAEVFVRGALGRGLDEGAAVRLAGRIAGLADRAIGEVSERGGVPVACGPGCTVCCELVVFATIPECVRIYAEVTTWPEERRAELVSRLEAFEREVGPSRDERFVRTRTACPMLKDGRCSVYASRPVSCRGYTSVDPALCRAYVDQPTKISPFSPNGEMDAAQTVAGGALRAWRASGRDEGGVELARSLRGLLRGEFSTAELLAQGRAVLPEANRDWYIGFSRPREGDTWLRERFAEIRVEVPMATREEIAKAEARIEQALGQLEASRVWDPRGAYDAMAELRPVTIGVLPGSPLRAVQRLGRLIHERIARPLAPELLEPLPRRRPGRVRIGIAGTLGDVSASNWALGWLWGIDRTAFETFAIKLAGYHDALTYRFRDAAEHFRSFVGDPLSIARAIRELDLDLLIYTDLGESPVNTQTAMFRLARRQSAGWGCPFSSGLATMDDYLAGESMLTPESQEEFSETLVRLPGSGLALARPEPVRLDWDRERLGLPEGFLAIYPQDPWKWSPDYDALLAEVSARLENPIVMFRPGEKIRARLETAGVRALWLEMQPTEVFRRILGLCDVALDSPSWSGGISALAALEAGTPVAHLPGPELRQRLAHGFCATAGLPGARDEVEYVEMATTTGWFGAVDGGRLFEDLEPVWELERYAMESTLREEGP